MNPDKKPELISEVKNSVPDLSGLSEPFLDYLATFHPDAYEAAIRGEDPDKVLRVKLQGLREHVIVLLSKVDDPSIKIEH